MLYLILRIDHRVLFALAIGVILLLLLPDKAPPPGPNVPAPQPLVPSLNALDRDWDSGGDIDWEIAAALGQLSNASYDGSDAANAVFRQWGFSDVHPVVKGSMSAYVGFSRRNAVVVFRGTDDLDDWLANLNLRSRNVSGGKVHAGFFDAYNSLQADIARLIQGRSANHVWITGHSLGGALALICGQDFVEGNDFTVAGVVTFGQPMIAKDDLAGHLDVQLRGRYQRFVNGSDIVTRVPPGYRHCGASVWFRNGEIIRSQPGMATYSRDDAEAAPVTTEPLPLSEPEFRQLQEELRRAQNVDEEDPRRARLYGGMLPFVRDHGMELYLSQITAMINGIGAAVGADEK